MSKSRRWSIASARCRPLRLEWRPSRLERAALHGLGVLAAFCGVASGLPRPVAWLLVPVIVLHAHRAARRSARRPSLGLLFPARGLATCDGRTMKQLRPHWRGPWLFLHWRDGNTIRRLAFWPDTLPAAQRRELRLALMHGEAAPSPEAVAP